MITKNNFKKALEYLEFKEKDDVFTKKFHNPDFELKADFKNSQLIYPEDIGFTVNERQTCNFKQAENFVVFECVHRLFLQGYHPKHIELEPKWQLGHGASGGRADILVKDNDDKALLIIECKTAGSEFSKAWNTTQTRPTQLFSYVQQTKSTKFISLYASDFIDNKVISNYYLINVTDNKELLTSNKSLKAFEDATTVEEIYEVWSQTYDKDYNTLGLFENNEAYKIGKSKFSVEDLQPVSSKDIQEKYNKFATILRKYNVSGRENAFDKLVNLFLCKVVDETQNKDELKFYWKGKAYDNPFDFQDRLQQLYKDGMKKFLGEDITYIDNSEIDSIFKHYDLDTIKKDIKSVLTELKFFTNNDFAFIDVHNEKLFYQNFAVLLEIARLIQDINLTSSDENQFLGDMFEGFLDQGVKQSEGQFFTPMPIVKFIINSLPKKENPKVIDYACGAGHFLNEYFTVNKNSQIIGIEKEYRLSKVAKVSSFMYGSDMQIIYNDALCSNKKIKNNDYDVLIANPPYSVKGFLETLSSEDRAKFELINAIDEKSYTANNAIECFFIERAKQLLAKNAVTGIVVPSSILNKGSQNINTKKANVYVGTREIILKYFDIVAIAEFGSGTFGKTGTNTVTLFLKRRCDKENLAETFKELAKKVFEFKLDFSLALQEKQMLEKYCSHCELDFEIYKTLLCENINDDIFKYDIFKEYSQEFLKLTETKNRKKKTYYKNLTKDEKEAEEKKELIKYIKLIEEDKFYYFCLAYKNSTDVVIVKSPSKNNENKKFLGYEWSTAKGNEGIHYITKSSINIDDESLEEEDKRILENLSGIKDINTPLYNPENIDDKTKINKIISDNFANIKTTIPEELKKFVSRANVIDMLDFSRVDFNKALSLSPSKKMEIESKWELISLGENCEIITKGTTPTSIGFNFVDNGINFIKIESINHSGLFDNSKFAFINTECNKKMSRSQLKVNDILFSIAGALGRTAIVDKSILPANTNQALAIIRLNKNIKFTMNYLYLILQADIIQEQIEGLKVGVAQPNLSLTQIGNFKIPLPPLNIQEEIVKECQKVDEEVIKANEIINQTKELIENEISTISGNMVKIEDIIQVQAGGTPKREKSEYWNGTINWLKSEVCQNCYVYKNQVKEKITELGLQKSSAKLLKKDSVLIALVGATIGKVGYLTFEATTNQNIAGLYPLDTNKLLPKYLYYQTKNLYPEFMKIGEGKFTMANLTFIRNLKIKLTDIKTQKEIVSKIEKLETKINQAKDIINNAKNLKEEVLRKYL